MIGKCKQTLVYFILDLLALDENFQTSGEKM